MTSPNLTLNSAPVGVLKYASGETARSGRQTLIRSATLLAIIVIAAGILHGIALIAQIPGRPGDLMPDAFRDLILQYVPRNFGAFTGVVAAGGLLVCAGHWLQVRPIWNWRFFIVLLLIHVTGLSFGIAYPERPWPKVLSKSVLSPAL